MSAQKARKIIGVIIPIACAIFIVFLIGGFIFLKNFDIARYKPQIIKAATQALARQVDFKDISLKVSFSEGIRLHLSDFVIGENPDFGGKDFFFAGEVDAGLDIFSFFLKRQISIPSIVIHSPRINIIRSPKGLLNVQSIGKPLYAEAPKAKKQSANLGVLSALLIKSFEIKNAELYFTEQFTQTGQKISITQLNLAVRGFSLNRPFEFSVDGAVLAPQTDLRVYGKAKLNLLKKEARLIDTVVSIDLSRLSLDELKALPAFKAAAIPQVVKGQLKATINEMTVSDKGVGALLMDISFSDGQVAAPDIIPGVSFEAKKIEFSLDNFSLDRAAPLRLNLAAALYQEQTNVSFKSDVFIDLKAKGARFANGKLVADLALWPLEKIKSSITALKDVILPEHLAGEFQVEVKDLSVQADGFKNVLLDAQLSEGEFGLKEALPGVAIELKKTNLIVKDFSLNRNFYFSLSTAYLSEEPDISIEGSAICDFNKQSAVVKDAVLGVDLDRVSLQRLKGSGLIVPDMPFPQSLSGKLEARLKSLAVTAAGVDWLNMNIAWRNGKISIPEVAAGISVTCNNIDLEVKDFSLKEAFDVAATLGYESGTPNIFFNGKVAFEPVSQNVHFSKTNIKANLSEIPFEYLKTTIRPLKDVILPEVIKGELAVMVNELSVGKKAPVNFLADISLKGGEISMKEVSPGIAFSSSHINADIQGFGLGKPFKFNVALAYLHDKPNIEAGGLVTIQLEDQSVAVKNFAVGAALSTFSIEQLKSSIPALKNVSFPEKTEGQFNIVIAEAVAGAKGLGYLNSRGSLRKGKIKLKEFSLPIEGLDTDFSLTEKDFSMDTIQANIGKGKIVAQLGVKDYLGFQKFILSTELIGIDLSEVLEQKQAPVKIEGLVFGSLKAQGQGSDINLISGEGNIEIKQAKLKDFNVLKTMLDKMSFFPNAPSRIETALAEKYKEKLNNKDTDIKKISALCVFSKGMVFIDPVSIEADEFIFSGKSQAGFDRKYSLDGNFKIPAELSAAMVQGVAEMRYLFDENNNISLPVHVVGQGSFKPVIVLTQTAVELGRNVLLNEGKIELEKALIRVLGEGQESVPSDAKSQQPKEAPQAEGTSVPQIVDDIFNKVFKGR